MGAAAQRRLADEHLLCIPACLRAPRRVIAAQTIRAGMGLVSRLRLARANRLALRHLVFVYHHHSDRITACRVDKKTGSTQTDFSRTQHWFWNFYAGDFIALFAWNPRTLDGQ